MLKQKVGQVDLFRFYKKVIREQQRRPRLIGQSYKASTLVIYDSRVIRKSNLLVITTPEL